MQSVSLHKQVATLADHLFYSELCNPQNPEVIPLLAHFLVAFQPLPKKHGSSQEAYRGSSMRRSNMAHGLLSTRAFLLPLILLCHGQSHRMAGHVSQGYSTNETKLRFNKSRRHVTVCTQCCQNSCCQELSAKISSYERSWVHVLPNKRQAKPALPETH